MKLDDFISETLRAIIKSVAETQEFAKQNGARINPHRINDYRGTDVVYYGKEEGIRPLSKIEFDIAVTVSSQQETGVTGGINVFSLNVGGKNSDTDLSQSVSRIRFSIDVVLPNVAP